MRERSSFAAVGAIQVGRTGSGGDEWRLARCGRRRGAGLRRAKPPHRTTGSAWHPAINIIGRKACSPDDAPVLNRVSTSKVVDRCPSCGVEHDHPVHECEACGSSVRYWCRKHSREIGWLSSDVCPRCPPGAARAPRPVPPPPPVAVPTSEPPAGPAPELPPRPWLRFEHRPATPAETPPANPTAPAPPPDEPAAPVPTVTEARGEGTKATRRGMGVRLFEAVLTVLQTGIVGVLVGVAAGGIIAYRAGAEVPLQAAIGGAKGGMAGLALGVLIAIAFFHRSAYPPETDG
jgi:hypothetical protein